MKTIKILICAAFIVGFGGYEFVRTPTVLSQSGSEPLGTPTRVSATDNTYNTKTNISWDTIRGATLYRIFRNTTNNGDTAVSIGTSASNNFFDTTSTAGQLFFYWVRAENGATISLLSASDQGSRTGTPQQGGAGPLQPPGAPLGNPVTAAKIYLGKALFWDEQMSSTRTVSCGTCHHSGTGGTDPRSTASAVLSTNPGPDRILGTPDDIRGSAGVPSNNIDGTYIELPIYGLNDQVTGRRAMPYINAAYSPSLFWDGRATSTFRDPLTGAVVLNAGAALESQVIGPPVSPEEMAHGGRDWADVAARMAASRPLALSPAIPTALSTWIGGRSYPELFQETFGTPEVTPVRIAMAIATFERSLYSDQTPFDLEAMGIPSLTAQEIRGRNIFNSPAINCNVCHGGSQFTNNGFFYIGVRPENDDTGREQVTGFPANRGEMRSPGLRNVGLRGSYFHNGQFTTLEQVVAFYNRGGDFDGNNKPNLITQLGLGGPQQADLVAFLRRPLIDPRVAAESGPFERPRLYMESDRVPQIIGTSRVGSGGITPQMKAISPPIVGNPNFTVSVSAAIGNASAVLVINETDPGVGNSIPAVGTFARIETNTQNTGAGNGWTSVSIPIPDNANLVGRTFFARWYITDAGAANGFSVSPAARFTIFGEASTVGSAAHVDFDGDQKTDISIFRPSVGEWWYLRSSDSGNRAFQFGAGTDQMVPADFTGDGKTDAAFWRPSSGEWFILRSEDGSYYSLPFGSTGDLPATGDFDGDGKADPAVFRPSSGTWYILASSQGILIKQFGSNGDLPQVGDYDGDGKDDIAVYRPSNGQWWIDRSTEGVIAATFGIETDRPLAQDYTGDGRTDIAFFRPSSGEWFILRSEDASYFSIPFGVATDMPAPGDYDGDGKADTAVFRPSTGTWYINRSNQGVLITGFGTSGDVPAPGAYVP